MTSNITELNKWIEGYVNPQSEESVKTNAINMVLLYMKSNKIDLQDVVQGLGDYLKSNDSILRARGTLLLSEVLCRLPDLPLNQDQVHFLAMFYCDRLQDYACSSEIVKGITGLITNHTPDYPDNQKLLRNIFSEVHPTSLTQAHRKMVLQVIDIMFNKCLSEIQELKNDFMVGYLQFIDNEKDPRNLIFSFKLLPKVIYNIPEHKHFLESLFEIISCYFPISFNPKGNDPNSITKDDLSNSLLNCFSCTPLLAEHSIPFLIDKICSNLIETKIEALQTLVYCCDRYGGFAVQPFLEEIWSTLRTLILTHKNTTVIEESKKTIFYLTRSFTKERKVLESFLSIMIKECLHHIKSSQDSKIAIYCASILYQSVSASLLSSKIILIHIFPNLFNFLSELQKQDTVQKVNEQNSVIALFNDLLKANSIAFEMYSNENKEPNPLEPFVDQLFKLFSDLLLLNSSSSIRSNSIECLSNLYISKKVHTTEQDDDSEQSTNEFLLDLEKRQFIIKSLVSLLNSSDNTLRHKSLDSLFTIASNEDPSVLNLYVIPTLLQMINHSSCNINTTNNKINNIVIKNNKCQDEHCNEDHSNKNENSSNENSNSNSTSGSDDDLKHYLEAFTKLCTHQPLLESVIPQIQVLLQHNIKETYQSNEDFEKSILILQSISFILEKSTNIKSMTICSKSILFPLIKGLYKQELISSSNDNNNNNRFNQILTPTLKMIHSIFENISIESQEPLLEKFIKLFLNGDTLVIDYQLPTTTTTTIIKPFEKSSPYKYLIPIFTTIISQSKLDLSENNQLKQSLYQMSLDVNVDDSIAISCAKAYSSIINKQQQQQQQDQINFDFFNDNLLKVINDTTTPLPLKIRHLDLFTWCTKALLTNGNSINIKLGSCLADIISNENVELSYHASKSFGILLSETDVLNEKSGSIIKILFEQKFFTLMFPILLESFKISKNKELQTISSHYLIAISNLLKHVPKEILLAELNEILPIVMQSLKSSDNNDQVQLLDSSLQTLTMLINETPSSFISYLDSLIPSLIKISTKSTKYNLKRSALEILTLLSKSIPFVNLFPYKTQIVTDIIPCLDDKKRIVRREAQKCRNSEKSNNNDDNNKDDKLSPLKQILQKQRKQAENEKNLIKNLAEIIYTVKSMDQSQSETGDVYIDLFLEDTDGKNTTKMAESIYSLIDTLERFDIEKRQLRLEKKQKQRKHKQTKTQQQQQQQQQEDLVNDKFISKKLLSIDTVNIDFERNVDNNQQQDFDIFDQEIIDGLPITHYKDVYLRNKLISKSVNTDSQSSNSENESSSVGLSIGSTSSPDSSQKPSLESSSTNSKQSSQESQESSLENSSENESFSPSSSSKESSQEYSVGSPSVISSSNEPSFSSGPSSSSSSSLGSGSQESSVGSPSVISSSEGSSSQESYVGSASQESSLEGSSSVGSQEFSVGSALQGSSLGSASQESSVGSPSVISSSEGSSSQESSVGSASVGSQEPSVGSSSVGSQESSISSISQESSVCSASQESSVGSSSQESPVGSSSQDSSQSQESSSIGSSSVISSPSKGSSSQNNGLSSEQPFSDNESNSELNSSQNISENDSSSSLQNNDSNSSSQNNNSNSLQSESESSQNESNASNSLESSTQTYQSSYESSNSFSSQSSAFVSSSSTSSNYHKSFSGSYGISSSSSSSSSYASYSSSSSSSLEEESFPISSYSNDECGIEVQQIMLKKLGSNLASWSMNIINLKPLIVFEHISVYRKEAITKPDNSIGYNKVDVWNTITSNGRPEGKLFSFVYIGNLVPDNFFISCDNNTTPPNLPPTPSPIDNHSSSSQQQSSSQSSSFTPSTSSSTQTEGLKCNLSYSQRRIGYIRFGTKIKYIWWVEIVNKGETSIDDKLLIKFDQNVENVNGLDKVNVDDDNSGGSFSIGSIDSNGDSNSDSNSDSDSGSDNKNIENNIYKVGSNGIPLRPDSFYAFTYFTQSIVPAQLEFIDHDNCVESIDSGKPSPNQQISTPETQCSAEIHQEKLSTRLTFFGFISSYAVTIKNTSPVQSLYDLTIIFKSSIKEVNGIDPLVINTSTSTNTQISTISDSNYQLPESLRVIGIKPNQPFVFYYEKYGFFSSDIEIQNELCSPEYFYNNK
ncbi:hypothetical protein ACTFIW_012311 [Dictyostelium discoideum]